MKRERSRLILWGIVLVLMLAVASITFVYSEPPPPKHVSLATGIEGGAYVGFGEELARMVGEARGPQVAVRRTQGSAENLRLLAQGEVDVAFVQAGTVSALSGKLDTRSLRFSRRSASTSPVTRRRSRTRWRT